MVIGNKDLGCKGFGCHNLEDKALVLAGFSKDIWKLPRKQVVDGYFLNLEIYFYFSWNFSWNFHELFCRIFQHTASYKCHKIHQIWLLLFKDFHEKCYNPVILCIGWHNADIGRHQGAQYTDFNDKQCPLHRYRSTSVYCNADIDRCRCKGYCL